MGRCHKKIDQLFQNSQDVIVEEFIDVIYYTSPVLNNFGDNIFLPCIEKISVLKGNVATYYQKRKIEGGLYRHIIMDKKRGILELRIVQSKCLVLYNLWTIPDLITLLARRIGFLTF